MLLSKKFHLDIVCASEPLKNSPKARVLPRFSWTYTLHLHRPMKEVFSQNCYIFTSKQKLKVIQDKNIFHLDRNLIHFSINVAKFQEGP